MLLLLAPLQFFIISGKSKFFNFFFFFLPIYSPSSIYYSAVKLLSSSCTNVVLRTQMITGLLNQPVFSFTFLWHILSLLTPCLSHTLDSATLQGLESKSLPPLPSPLLPTTSPSTYSTKGPYFAPFFFLYTLILRSFCSQTPKDHINVPANL